MNDDNSNNIVLGALVVGLVTLAMLQINRMVDNRRTIIERQRFY